MANPLNLLMPVTPGVSVAQIAGSLAQLQPATRSGLTAVGTVHFARFVLLDASQPNLRPTAEPSDRLVLGVITEYDGDFDPYVQDFIARIGGVFDALLPFVVGGEALVPVADHPDEFTDFVRANDLAQAPGQPGLYSAYPQTVQEILAAFATG